MLTIYKTILQDNLQQDDINGTLLRSIVEKYTAEDGYIDDGQALFDEICDLEGWTEPSPDNEETAIGQTQIYYGIILKNGSKAYMNIFENNDCPHINIFTR